MLTKEELELNAKLQQKKNNLRKALAEIGVVKKDKKNTGQNYTYFSEAGYKELFTKLLSQNQLELTFSVDDVEVLQSKNNDRLIKGTFTLTDCETGYNEKSIIYGEALDFSDKAIYKAYTGSLKYYLANTFAVATGDEVETDNIKSTSTKQQYINEEQKKQLLERVPETVVKTQLQVLKVKSIEKLTVQQARKIMSDYKAVSNKESN